MIYHSVEQLSELIGAKRIGSSEGRIQFLLTDSRSVCFPEETLFFAIKTSKGDGADYIPELIGRGVKNFVVTSLPDGVALEGLNFLLVGDVVQALHSLAKAHRQAFDIPVVGITGSNGKTIVKEWLYQILSDRIVTRSPRSYNSQLGVPLSLWLIDSKTELALIEAGVSQPSEMERLQEMIRPTIGVFTFLGSAHDENFPSMREKCIEKLSLFAQAEKVIVGIDNPIVRQSIESAQLAGEVLTWSKSDESASFVVLDIERSSARTTVKYRYEGAEGQYALPFTSSAAIDNSITCALTALQLGVTIDELQQRMPLLEPVEMRLNVVEGKNGLTIINDSYNSDVNSLTIALDFLHRRRDEKRKSVVILSDILQTGVERENLYRSVSDLLTAHAIDKFIGIGDDLCASQELFSIEEKHFFHTVEAFLASDVLSALSNELVLLKGARCFGFERIEEGLVEKVHETKLEIDLNAVVANLNFFRSHLNSSTRLTCMLKAEAYGAGAVEIAKTLQEQRVDYLAVAVADEGVELRRRGIKGSIMVMNPEMSAFNTLFDYDLEPEIYSFRLLDALIASAQRAGINGFPCHIKIDTGMNRLGFSEGDIDSLIERLKGQSAVIPRSVFSHFAGADEESLTAFTAEQYKLFARASERLQAAFPHRLLKHICNSAAILAYPQYQLDMCRLGLGLYGINPLDNSTINNVATLSTVVLQLRSVEAHQSVGYGRKTIMERASRIAVLPIGYADGVNRRLGNRAAYCIINGQKAYYVGNICMDICMVDVTDIDCKEGDRVEIFGTSLPVSTLAQLLGTIPYELLTSVSPRVKRVYFKD